MTPTERALQKSIDERDRKVREFVTVPPGATFPELLDMDYEIARLQLCLRWEQQMSARQS